MEERLRECPFCGCVPTLDRFNARCPGCDAEINAATRGLAAEMWNRRTPSPAVRALVEACKGLVPTLRSGDWGNQDETADEIDKALAAVEKEIES